MLEPATGKAATPESQDQEIKRRERRKRAALPQVTNQLAAAVLALGSLHWSRRFSGWFSNTGVPE
jgi:hypothetical protein